MRAPGFWQAPPERPGLWARLLTPLGWLYARGTARRLAVGRAGAHRAGIPVICVGNLGAGGAGKTPTVIALIEILSARGIAAHVVSRGHGGRVAGPLRVDERRHRAEEVGDEPVLLAAFAPTWVARDRAAGVRAAEAAGAGAILLDDGFQNPAVVQDLALIVVDAARGFGNGRVIPAGPLREPVAVGMGRADLVLTIGPPDAQAAFDRRWGPGVAALPRLRAALEPLQTGMSWQGLRALAFAGIAYPEKFFATLRGLGAEVVRALPLDDHQPLPLPLMARLEAEARHCGAQLVTTEKDAARLAPGLRGRVLTLPVRLSWHERAALDAALDRVVGRAEGPG
ncbi:MAG: tetraacyldisaccharide 4'-kinase [Alkalilacustris sp.]